MGREWKAGDVALVRPMYCDQPDAVAVRTGVPSNMGWAYSMTTRDGSSTQTWSSDPDGLSVVRPLVVIDPEDREQVERLTYVVMAHYWSEKHQTHTEAFAAGLREFLNLPKPEEPTGDGAVVEDRRGHRWVRIAGPEPERESKPWRHRGHTARTWEQVRAVRVLSEGVPS